MLAGAAREEKGSEGGGGQVRLLDVDTGRLSGLKYELVCHFNLPFLTIFLSHPIKNYPMPNINCYKGHSMPSGLNLPTIMFPIFFKF